MAELMAKSACEGLLPITRGGLTLTEADPQPLFAIQPFVGRQKAVGDALGGALPKPNRTSGKTGARVLWFGRETYLTQGLDLPEALSKLAAVTDQSDAWAVVLLEGPEAEAALSRLVPVDLRGKNFKRGHTCRTLIEHMNASITRTGEKTFQIMVFRSMAHTLVHELDQAMTHLAARSGN